MAKAALKSRAPLGGKILRLAMASAFLCAATLLRAQSFTIVHSFPPAPVYPISIVAASDGNFYGTAASGGDFNLGCIYKMSPAGAVNLLYSFPDVTDGGLPTVSTLIEGPDGNLYGTTNIGGAYGTGSIFRITPAGAFTTLSSFGGSQNDAGSDPNALTVGHDGNLYGTTNHGGLYDLGAVFVSTLDGALTGLYSFSGGVGGEYPTALTLGRDGSFYGADYRTIFKITPNGVFTILCADAGRQVTAPVEGPDGSLYGTTGEGLGTVYELTPAGTLTTIHSMDADTDGAFPSSLTIGSDGSLYGTTEEGAPNDAGAVFVIPPGGTFSVLHAFSGGRDGGIPYGVTLGPDGNLYGATSQYGPADFGTLYRLTPAGALTTLYNFGSVATDGAFPSAGLIEANDGSLYGMTSAGGAFSVGAVIKLMPAGTESLLYSFGSGPSDGALPFGELVEGPGGNFYGTTSAGGDFGLGTVFELTPQGALTVLHSFGAAPGEGTNPRAGVVSGDDGNLYGTTYTGGSHGAGTVFKLSIGHGLATLYSFGGFDGDGLNPSAALALGSDDNLYGTTYNGGAHGTGAVFKITRGGTLTTLHSFDDASADADGANPFGLVKGGDGNFYGTTDVTAFRITAGGLFTTLHSFLNLNTGFGGLGARLMLGSDGNLYGTTQTGGSFASGSAFRMTPAGMVTTLYSFQETPVDLGAINPVAPLVQGRRGSLYGTTPTGGNGATGAIFKLTVPFANPDVVVLRSPAALTIDVLSNDQSSNPSSLRVIAVGAPHFGEAEIANGGKTVVYHPRTAFSSVVAADTFQYTVTDNSGQTDIGSVTVQNPHYTGAGGAGPRTTR